MASPPRTPPSSPRSYAERIAEHARAHREAQRDARRDFYRLVLDLMISVAGGMLLLGLAVHSTDPETGKAYWWAGHALWVAGLTFSLMRAYRRAERRGEW